MRLGYNTNGFAHHDLLDAVDLLAEIGYRSVALTLDRHALDPTAGGLDEQLAEVHRRLKQYGMTSVVETGARFLLDPRTKHEPTLLTADRAARARRVDFLRGAIDVAARLNSDCVSLWSGVLREEIADEAALERLAEGLGRVLQHAERRGVVLGFEPEPGMFIASMSHFQRLLEWIDSPLLQLTLDVGHLYCQGELPLADYIRRWRARIVNVHIEDMRAGVHEHLMFGDGEIDFPPVIRALAEIGYRGGLHVELSRHSHEAPDAARRSFEFLAPLLERP